MTEYHFHFTEFAISPSGNLNVNGNGNCSTFYTTKKEEKINANIQHFRQNWYYVRVHFQREFLTYIAEYVNLMGLDMDFNIHTDLSWIARDNFAAQQNANIKNIYHTPLDKNSFLFSFFLIFSIPWKLEFTRWRIFQIETVTSICIIRPKQY